MSQIICCANSKKEGERCIAGINPINGKWVRPVSKLSHGAVAKENRIIDGKEPSILDVLEIPMENYGPDKGFQPENKLLKDGKWELTGRLDAKKLSNYCEADDVVLHNRLDYIPFNHLRLIPRRGWKSIQLINSKNVECYQSAGGDKPKWRATFDYQIGRRNMDLRITDPVIIEKLNSGKEIKGNCILTISLGVPWRPNSDIELRCYKLIAGLIKL